MYPASVVNSVEIITSTVPPTLNAFISAFSLSILVGVSHTIKSTHVCNFVKICITSWATTERNSHKKMLRILLCEVNGNRLPNSHITEIKSVYIIPHCVGNTILSYNARDTFCYAIKSMTDSICTEVGNIVYYGEYGVCGILLYPIYRHRYKQKVYRTVVTRKPFVLYANAKS